MYRSLVLLTFFLCHWVNAEAPLTSADFFSPLAITSAVLSPDGSRVAALVKEEGGQQLKLINPRRQSNNTLIDLTAFGGKDTEIRRIAWIDNTYLAAQFSEVNRGVADLLDTRQRNYIIVLKILPGLEQPEIYSIKTKGWLVEPLPEEDDTFLYAKSSIYSKVYRIKASALNRHNAPFSKLTKMDGGQFVAANEVAKVDGYARHWFIDDKGKATAALHYVKGDLTLSKMDEEGNAISLKVWRKASLSYKKRGVDSSGQTKKLLIPVESAGEENTFYCLDFFEEEERSVYKINFSTDTTELVYESTAFKISDLITSPDDQQLIGVRVLADGYYRDIYFDSNELLENASSDKLADTPVTSEEIFSVVTGYNEQTGASLNYSESHKLPGHYLYRESEGAKATLIGSEHPALHGRLDSSLIIGSIENEGLQIPYLLTISGQQSRTAQALVVLPHGGPIGPFDSQYFDVITQFLSSQGYAVLRVNFRGSGGYSRELKEAGKREWGNLMLDDIHQAMLEVTAREDIDAARVCAVGLSYGGYASSMLAIKYPEHYKCAASIAGVSDLPLLLNGPTRAGIKGTDAWYKEQVGNVEKDYESFRAISPVYLLDALQRPLLIIHGEKDLIVDIEHAQRMRLVLQALGKPFEFYTFTESGHNFEEEGVMADLFERVVKFVGSHINPQ